jgi:PBSX family phage terminase large subunit
MARKSKRPLRPISSFKWVPFSDKQLKILKWWGDDSPHKDKEGIICDGAVRSGKTLMLSFSFILWSMSRFDGKILGMAGKTVNSFRRNVLFDLVPILLARGYSVEDLRTDNLLVIRYQGHINFYHIFGGRDESSQDLVQGLTCAGFFFDEVVLMPESFVNQAIARCSVENSKLWFSCNPQGPKHWFKTEFIDRRRTRGLYRLHFLLEDNPSLSTAVVDRYKRSFSGVFFQRFVLGLWVLSDGVIYDMWEEATHMFSLSKRISEEPGFLNKSGSHYIAVDYGTSNACSFLDIWETEDQVYILREYLWDGKKKKQKTDHEYIKDFIAFAEESPCPKPITRVIVDPSALSFKVELRSSGYMIKDADNEVLDGIRLVASMLSQRRLFVEENCKNLRSEFSQYSWDSKASERGIERPIKLYDHGLDALRYYVFTILTHRRVVGY